VQDFLSLLRAHGADFHASLRELANFHPSKIDDDAYRRSFAKRWVANTTIDLKSDSAMRAEEGITAWLRTYAARATSADEKAAWEKDAPDGEWEEIAPSPCAPSTPALCSASGSRGNDQDGRRGPQGQGRDGRAQGARPGPGRRLATI
jgi:hypothetical protein